MNDRIQTALVNWKRARGLLKHFLEEIDQEKWCWQPAEGINHVAWQVGHLAVAQYGLCIKRVVGDSPESEDVLPLSFLKRYGKGSTPSPDTTENASVEELLATLDAVDERMHEVLATTQDEELEVELKKPHPMFSTVLGGVEFAPQHEMMHIGQIVILRRLMGMDPTW